MKPPEKLFDGAFSCNMTRTLYLEKCLNMMAKSYYDEGNHEKALEFRNIALAVESAVAEKAATEKAAAEKAEPVPAGLWERALPERMAPCVYSFSLPPLH